MRHSCLRNLALGSCVVASFAVLLVCLPTDSVAQSSLTLKRAASGMFEIGVGTAADSAKTPSEKRLLESEFGYATPENCMKPAAIQAVEGKFEFEESDQFIENMTSHGLKSVGHCLVWAKDDRTPEWFYKDGDEFVSSERLLTRMKTHIDTVIGRYGDRIDQWDVVNEALDDGQPMWRPSGWQNACGPSFIVKAFEYAHAADPTAMLIYNDYRSELPGKREKLFKLIKFLKENNAPVHAIGLQGHYELDSVPLDDLDFTLTEIKKLGLKVVISEVDIDVVKRGRWWADGNIHREELKSYDPFIDGCPPEILKRQAEQYQELFAVYAKHADNIERITFWNLHDGQSWLNYFPWERVNYPVLFDRNSAPKPAYDSVRSELLKFREQLNLVPVEPISLWPGGAPGFESRRNEPEEAKDWWVKNIHNPTLTPMFPDHGKTTGEALIICPGGGHRQLVFNAEGTEAGEYLRQQGIATFVLKYRLGREENSPYSIEKHALEDGQRAVRYVRANAKKWGINPDRIGMLGFSAGGEVVSMVAYANPDGDPHAVDPIDRASAKLNYQLLVYPGPLGIPEKLPADTPPAFLLVANDDGAARVVVNLLSKFRDANVPVEMHLYRKGGHGFNMGNRSKLKSIQTWPQRMADWMSDNNVEGK